MKKQEIEKAICGIQKTELLNKLKLIIDNDLIKDGLVIKENKDE